MNREIAVILALGAVAIAAALVSLGSWVLLWTEHRRRRASAQAARARLREAPAGEDRDEPGSP